MQVFFKNNFCRAYLEFENNIKLKITKDFISNSYPQDLLHNGTPYSEDGFRVRTAVKKMS